MEGKLIHIAESEVEGWGALDLEGGKSQGHPSLNDTLS